jgi:Tol biopolymer transport system component
MKKNYALSVGILLSLLAMVLTACSKQANAADIVTPAPTTNPAPVQQATDIVTPAPTAHPAPVQQATDIITPTPTAEPAPVQQTYDDPFAYCAAVGTMDMPDARYTGPQISEEIINGFKVAAGLEESTMPMDMFEKMTIWRCMNGQVYACNFGANLPCNSKANTDKTPSPVMEDYCKANPDSEFIPMSVTGHSTIYSWYCVKDTPELLDQIENVDAAGYLAQIWYSISPNASPKPESSVTPILLGGSSQILFSSNRGGAYDDLYLLDFTSSQVTRLTSGDSNTFPGPFSPDGSQILYTGYGLITSYVGVMSADGTHPLDLTHAQVDEGFPTWSPDGKSIAFTSQRDGNNEIYVMNADGSGAKRLTNNPMDDFAPAWSPDGTQIAFVSDRNNSAGVNNLYVMNADGTNVQRLTNGSEIDYSPAWSPDGAWIAFRAHHDGAGDIYRIKPDGTGLVNLTDNPAEDWAPAWSPDGSLLAFQTNRDGNWEIYVMNADGSQPHNITNNTADDQMPYWK